MKVGGLMSTLSELLAVDHRGALEFFFTGLKDVCEVGVNRQELLYNASVLAHYAQTSTASDTDFPTPASLASVFDHFVLDTAYALDATMSETAASQCLLMSGFFENHMRNRHSINWYSRLGRAFFHRASSLDGDRKKAELLGRMAQEFESWRRRHARLSRELRDVPFLLDLPTPGE